MTPAIELSQNRIVTIRQAGNRYDYAFAPIAARTWLAYFDAIVNSSERRGKEEINEFDTSKARLGLIAAALQSVTGYAGELPPNWKDALPLKHRLAVADRLMRVSASDPEDGSAALSLGEECVRLIAQWSANEDGAMLEYGNLVHRFETPTAEHLHRYQRDLSRSTIVGGARNGKTIWHGAQKTLCAIYDELVTGVDGYTWQGANLASREHIAERMDAYHKVTATVQLFKPAELDAQEEVE